MNRYGNVILYIGIIISILGGLSLDSEPYKGVLMITIIGLILCLFGIIYEYRKAKQIQRNRERRAYQRMIERERRKA